MPVVHLKLQYGSQQGYNDTGANYATGGGNYGQKTDRVNILRFNYIPFPKGSTINSATLTFAISVKNNDSQTLSLQPWMDGNIGYQNLWLDTSRNEWTGRTYSNHGVAASQFTWNPLGPNRQTFSLNVQPHLTACSSHANWTLAGGSATFLVSCSAVQNSDQIYLHTHQDGLSPVLSIDYTPPASDGKQTVVNVQENQNFDRSANSQGAFSMEPYGYNTWFGAYTQPNYAIINTMPTGLPAPPGGGKILEITPTTGRPMVHNGVPTLEEGEWYNFSVYQYIPSAAPANMNVDVTVLGHRAGTENSLPHAQWNRVDISFIAGTGSLWCVVQGNGSGFTWDSTCKFYVANVQLTKGRRVRPYLYGEKVLANADHGWAGNRTGGFVRAVPPTVTPTVTYDKARRKYWAAGWTYSSTAGHAQIKSTVKTSKVAP